MNKLTAITCLFLISLPIGLIAQSDCEVLLEDINGTYEGDCKKGKADGKGKSAGTDTYEGEFKKGLPDGYGVYTWSDGNVYKGEFKKGLKEGKGEMSLGILSGKDSLLVGFWEKDEYIGSHEKPFELYFRSPQISNVLVKQVDDPDEKNIIYVTIMVQNRVQPNPQISVEPTIGFYKMIMPSIRTANIHVQSFPFRFTLTHEGGTADIEIFDPGSYNLTVNKNQAKLD